jgi:hypothetical protein
MCQGVDGVLLVYDVTDVHTFARLPKVRFGRNRAVNMFTHSS